MKAVSGAIASVLLFVTGAASAAEGAAEPARVVPLMTRVLADLPGKEVAMLTVEYLPGGANPPHPHHPPLFLLIQLRMQVAGRPAETLGPGQVFYEAPSDVHETSANASATAPAKFLVVMLKDRDKPASRPVESGAPP